MKLVARVSLVIVAVIAAMVIGFWGVSRILTRGRTHRPAATAAPAAQQQPAAEPAAPVEIKKQSVKIYQRADTPDLALVAVPSEVIWFSAPVDRARQIVQLVLEGAPGASGAVAPGPAGIRYRDVYVAGNGTAWVDLDGASLDGLAGADEELALVASLARSLIEALDDVHAVGVLVDGHPRATLAGHVDLTRPFNGHEAPLLGGEPAPPAGQPAPEGQPAPTGQETPPPATSGDGTGEQGQ